MFVINMTEMLIWRTCRYFRMEKCSETYVSQLGDGKDRGLALGDVFLVPDHARLGGAKRQGPDDG